MRANNPLSFEIEEKLKQARIKQYAARCIARMLIDRQNAEFKRLYRIQ